MSAKNFQIKVARTGYGEYNYATAYMIHSALLDYFSNVDTDYDIEVVHHDPENERKDRTKIDAIVRIRSILRCQLREAKTLADAAEYTPGHVAYWGDVKVICYPAPTGSTTAFQVEIGDNG